MKLLFTVHDGRTDTGYRTIDKQFDSEELAVDYLHKYHNRATGWYTLIVSGGAGKADKVTRKYDKTGVLL